MLTPFGATYSERTKNGIKGDECVHCGRHVKEPFRWMIKVLDGGSRYSRTTDDPGTLEQKRGDEASYMGWFPVGPECRKVLASDGVIVQGQR